MTAPDSITIQGGTFISLLPKKKEGWPRGIPYQNIRQKKKPVLAKPSGAGAYGRSAYFTLSRSIQPCRPKNSDMKSPACWTLFAVITPILDRYDFAPPIAAFAPTTMPAPAPAAAPAPAVTNAPGIDPLSAWVSNSSSFVGAVSGADLDGSSPKPYS